MLYAIENGMDPILSNEYYFKNNFTFILLHSKNEIDTPPASVCYLISLKENVWS